MCDFSLETGEDILRVTCERCGNEKKRVWGFVSKPRDAQRRLLRSTERHRRLPKGRTDAQHRPVVDGTEPSRRSWCHNDPDKFQLVIRNPNESNFILGRKAADL
jgi:hypothetical protein